MSYGGTGGHGHGNLDDSEATSSIVQIDLDAVCERLHVGTRNVVKKLSRHQNVFPLGSEEGSSSQDQRSPTVSMGAQKSPQSGMPGTTPQEVEAIFGSLGAKVGSLGGGLSPLTGLSPGTGGPLHTPSPRSAGQSYNSGFGFPLETGPSQRDDYIEMHYQKDGEYEPLMGSSGERKRSGMQGIFETPIGFRKRADSLVASGSGSYGSAKSRSLLQDPSLLHQPAYVIPSKDDGPAFVAVPQPPEALPLKKRLGLPRIPSEVKKVNIIQRKGLDQKTKVYVLVEFARPLFGWLILLVGVTMMASVGPISSQILEIDYEGQHVSGFLLGSWNAQGLVVFFALWSIVAIIMGDWTPDVHRYFFSLKGFTLLSLSGIISGAGSGCWTLSFVYTSVEQSYLFNSFHPTLIILCRLVSLQPIFLGEIVGLLFGLSGALISATSPDPNHHHNLFGDALAFCSSISLCFYLLCSKSTRNHLPLPCMLTVVCTFSALTQSIMAWCMGGLTWDFNHTHGIFGYWQPEYIWWWTVMLIVTSVGQAGYIGSLRYLNPVVVSICMTMEPIMAVFIKNMLYMYVGEVTVWPPVVGIIGGLLIIGGTILVSLFSKHESDGVEVDVGHDAQTITVPVCDE